MAEPVTWTLATIAIIGSTATAVQQYQTQKAAGKAAKDWEEYNAKVSEREAEAASQKAAYEASKARREARRLRGRQMALLSKSGTLSSEGSPLLLMAESAANQELDIMMIEREGLITSQQKEQEAKAHIAYGKQEESFGRARATGSLLSGLTQTAQIGLSAWSASGRGSGSKGKKD